MTNDIKIPRELAERLLNPTSLYEAEDELRALLAAPVVESQPVLWFKHLKGSECKSDGRTYDVMFCPMDGYQPLYASPPAPVAVVLPIKSDFYLEVFKLYGFGPDKLCMLTGEDLKRLWLACIDKVKELNQ